MRSAAARKRCSRGRGGFGVHFFNGLLNGIPDLVAPMALFVAVVGSIYAGIATPSEAASVGVVMALLLAAYFRSLNWKMLLSAFESTMRTTAMILIIVFAALFLNFVLGFVGLTDGLLTMLNSSDMSPTQTIVAIVILFLVLGMFMETLSMMLITVPVLFPVVAQLGVDEYSGVWFGILVTLLMEAALITPPIGLNLFVAQGIRKRGGRFGDVAIGSLPFILPMLALIFLLIAFPRMRRPFVIPCGI